MSLGALAFLNPWLLAALASLPLIYWLLRTVPPRPRQVDFPPTRILVGIENRDKQPAKTPWWLMLIRLLAAALIILALAEPVLNPTREKGLRGAGPVAIVVDNGWAGAHDWAEKSRMVDRFISEAEAQSRPVVVLPTASSSKAATARIEAPSDARATAAALQPQPFQPNREGALAALASVAGARSDLSVVWLTDGIDHDAKTAAFADRLAALSSSGSFVVVSGKPGTEALGLVAGAGGGGKLQASVIRAEGAAREGVLHAYSVRGARLGEAPFKLATGETASAVTFEMPLELRNQVTRVEVAGGRSAGAVNLLDARSQWQRVGLISGESREQAQPLLAPLYYINKALAPFSELVTPKETALGQAVEVALKQNATSLFMADIGTLSGEVKERVDEWVKKGGVLVRFAGPRLEKGGDELLPVPLRLGGRTLGGALSWSTPQPVAAFDDASLFAGLAVPAEVTVNRQVLADPARIGTDVAVWARLKDGTPLVTSARRGQGRIVLFHITANSDWSNLPLSGLFVEMLRRIAALGGSAGGGGDAAIAAEGGTAPAGEGLLPPFQTLDGYGTLKAPPPTAQPIAIAAIAETKPSLDHPPGYYGPAATPRALNIIGPKTALTPLPALPAAAERRGIEGDAAQPLKPSLLGLALALILADILAVIALQAGGLALSRLKGAGRAAILAAIASGSVMFAASDLSAQTRTPAAAGARVSASDGTALAATGKVTLGYVLTGDPATDQASRQGLLGLGKVLAVRTAVEPGEPQPVEIERDEIAFYPVLYWPVLASARALSDAALGRVDAYMKQGGLIIFDTRDYGQGFSADMPTSSKGGQALQRIIGRLDLPRLEPVPATHVLTKAFYLLGSFPGRYDGGQLWVEAGADEAAQDDSRKARRADGVTSIMITSNDFASAWALDERGRPIYPVSPGGEQQREYALRAGINIVMHALTGNYKADQVHVPALLERLGQ